MASVLCVVHGMGVHGQGWSRAIATKLEEVAGRYRAFTGDPAKLWQHVELFEVRYDDVLQAQVDRWRAEAGGVAAFIAQHQLVAGADLSWVEDFADEDPDFFWTHVADVLLYRFFLQHRAAVRARVAAQIVGKVRSLPNRAFDDCAVLAHSLGTAVAHDSLHLIASGTFGGQSRPFDPLSSRFRAVCMLANTSRVLQADILAYDSLVRGGPRNHAKSMCSQFLSWGHKWDPVALVKAYAPDPFDARWPANFNTIGEIAHFRDWNVHGFEHYLDNPRVHVPLINLMCGKDVIRAGERTEKLDRYERFGGRLRTIPEIEARLQAILREVGKLHENSDLRAIFEVVRAVRAEVVALKALVEPLIGTLATDIA